MSRERNLFIKSGRRKPGWTVKKHNRSFRRLWKIAKSSMARLLYTSIRSKPLFRYIFHTLLLFVRFYSPRAINVTQRFAPPRIIKHTFYTHADEETVLCRLLVHSRDSPPIKPLSPFRAPLPEWTRFLRGSNDPRKRPRSHGIDSGWRGWLEIEPFERLWEEREISMGKKRRSRRERKSHRVIGWNLDEIRGWRGGGGSSNDLVLRAVGNPRGLIKDYEAWNEFDGFFERASNGAKGRELCMQTFLPSLGIEKKRGNFEKTKRPFRSEIFFVSRSWTTNFLARRRQSSSGRGETSIPLLNPNFHVHARKYMDRSTIIVTIEFLSNREIRLSQSIKWQSYFDFWSEI